MSSRRIKDVATSVMPGKRASTFPGPDDWMYAEGFCKGQTLRERMQRGGGGPSTGGVHQAGSQRSAQGTSGAGDPDVGLSSYVQLQP